MPLALSHIPQRQQADCLVACTAMVLRYLHIPFDYNQLLQRFGTTSAGTPFSRIDWLKEWRLTVVRGEGNLEILAEYLDLGLPVIVAVQTWPFAHWQTQDTEHTVVVVGIEQGNVAINDPAVDQAPQVVNQPAFLAAWGDRDYEFAVIGLEDFDSPESAVAAR